MIEAVGDRRGESPVERHLVSKRMVQAGLGEARDHPNSKVYPEASKPSAKSYALLNDVTNWDLTVSSSMTVT